jgi:quercetin dioxygenase-like cupin family protein
MRPMDLGAFLNHTDGLPRATTLFQGSGLRGLLLHLNAGEQIPEHQTRGAITVHCLQGEATFGSGEEQVTLRPASLISLAPAVPHCVMAQQDTLLLVTVWEPVRDPSA